MSISVQPSRLDRNCLSTCNWRLMINNNYLPVKPYIKGIKYTIYSSYNSVITTKILEVCDN